MDTLNLPPYLLAFLYAIMTELENKFKHIFYRGLFMVKLNRPFAAAGSVIVTEVI